MNAFGNIAPKPTISWLQPCYLVCKDWRGLQFCKDRFEKASTSTRPMTVRRNARSFPFKVISTNPASSSVRKTHRNSSSLKSLSQSCLVSGISGTGRAVPSSPIGALSQGTGCEEGTTLPSPCNVILSHVTTANDVTAFYPYSR